MPQGDYTTGSYEGQSRRVTQAKKYIIGRGYSGPMCLTQCTINFNKPNYIALTKMIFKAKILFCLL